MPTKNITTAGTTTPQQYQQPFLPDFQPESATTTTTAATSVLHVRAEAIARRLQLVLPDIYQDVLNARTNLLSAIKICSGGGEWARQLVQNSAIIRRLTNSATDLTNIAQKNLKRLLHEMDELSDNTIEKILQMIDQAQRSLQQAYDRSKSVADTKENENFGEDILVAQQKVLLLMKDVTTSLKHATSICWVETERIAATKEESSSSSSSSSLSAKPASIEANEANAAEQRSLPFVPPPILKHTKMMKKALKPSVPVVDCVVFCASELRSRTKLQQSGCMHGCRGTFW